MFERRNFDVERAFKALDEAGKGHVDRDDVTRLLEERFLPTEGIDLLLSKWDKKGFYEAQLPEFIREMRPKLV